MMKKWKIVAAFACLFCALIEIGDNRSVSKLPPYIHTCKKNDPKINDCLKQFFESFQSKFTTGIPEIGIPIFDPLKLDKLDFNLPGNVKNRMTVYDVKVYGLRDMKLKDISINLDRLEIKIKATMNQIQAEGTYDVDSNMMNMALKGKGPFSGNASDVFLDGVVQGKIIEKNGDKLMHFTKADGEVTWKTYHIKIDNLFPDKKANQAVNNVMNSPAGMSMAKSQMPILKKVVIGTLLEYVNKIVEQVPFDAIFQ